jgi:uncharacterized damage-inducible protein DinB
MPQSRLDSACARLNFSRSLIHEYIADLTPDEWFWQPTEGVTHVAWQVGHLALVEYHLLLKRIRGERAEDAQLLHVDSYAKKYGRGSRPNRDREANYGGDELKETLERVHAQAWAEMAAYTDDLLDVPLAEPHPRFSTKLEAIEFCSQHELLHAGQIALLRRLMGRPPLR